MRDAAGEAAAKILQNRRKVVVRVALVQEDGLAGLGRDFQLRDEGRALRIGRREIAKIVQAAFADRDDLGQAQQFAQLVRGCETSKLARMVRDARRRCSTGARDGRPPSSAAWPNSSNRRR